MKNPVPQKNHLRDFYPDVEDVEVFRAGYPEWPMYPVDGALKDASATQKFWLDSGGGLSWLGSGEDEHNENLPEGESNSFEAKMNGCVRGYAAPGELGVDLDQIENVEFALKDISAWAPQLMLVKMLFVDTPDGGFNIPVLEGEDALDAWKRRNDARHRVKAGGNTSFWITPKGEIFEFGKNEDHMRYARKLAPRIFDFVYGGADEDEDGEQTKERFFEALTSVGYVRGAVDSHQLDIGTFEDEKVQKYLEIVRKHNPEWLHVKTVVSDKTEVPVLSGEDALDAWKRRKDVRHRVKGSIASNSNYWILPTGKRIDIGEENHGVYLKEVAFPDKWALMVKEYAKAEGINPKKLTDQALADLGADEEFFEEIINMAYALGWIRAEFEGHGISLDMSFGGPGDDVEKIRSVFKALPTEAGFVKKLYVDKDNKTLYEIPVKFPGQTADEAFERHIKKSVKGALPVKDMDFDSMAKAWLSSEGEIIDIPEGGLHYMTMMSPEDLKADPYGNNSGDILNDAIQAGWSRLWFGNGALGIDLGKGVTAEEAFRQISVQKPEWLFVQTIYVDDQGKTEEIAVDEGEDAQTAWKHRKSVRKTVKAGKWRDAYWVRPDGSLLEVPKSHAEAILDIPEYKAVAEAGREGDYTKPLIGYAVTAYRKAIADGWARVSSRRGALYIEARDEASVKRAIQAFPGSGITELAVDFTGGDDNVPLQSFEIPVLEGEDALDAWQHRKDIRHRVAASSEGRLKFWLEPGGKYHDLDAKGIDGHEAFSKKYGGNDALLKKGWSRGGIIGPTLYMELGKGKKADWVLSKLPTESLMVGQVAVEDDFGSDADIIPVDNEEGEDAAEAWGKRKGMHKKLAAGAATRKDIFKDVNKWPELDLRKAKAQAKSGLSMALDLINGQGDYTVFPGFKSQDDMIAQCWKAYEIMAGPLEDAVEHFGEDFAAAYNAISDLYDKSSITVYRTMSLKEETLSNLIESAENGVDYLRKPYGKGYGIFWAHDLEGAQVYRGGEPGDKQVTFTAEAPKASIDWQGSLLAQVRFSVDEYELRMKKGAPLTLKSIYGFGEEHPIPGLAITAGLSSTLYHITDLGRAGEILDENRFYLTPAAWSKAEDEHRPNKKYYYLSTARTPHSRYFSAGATKAILVLDGEALGHRYKGGAVDYWGPTFRRIDPLSTESEDRVWSEKREIPDAKSYINEIHVLVDVDASEMDRWRGWLVPAIQSIARSGIKTWAYKDKDAFLNLDKAKAVPLMSLLPTNTKTPSPARPFPPKGPQTDEARQSAKWAREREAQRPSYGAEAIGQFLALINVDDYDALPKQSQIFLREHWDPSSVFQMLEVRMHNSKKEKDFKSLDDLAKKAGDAGGLKKLVFDTWAKWKGPEGILEKRERAWRNSKKEPIAAGIKASGQNIQDLLAIIDSGAYDEDYYMSSEADYDWNFEIDRRVDLDGVSFEDAEILRTDEASRREWANEKGRANAEEGHPSYFFSFNRRVAPNEWLIHFTNSNPWDIVKGGFKGREAEILGLTTYYKHGSMSGPFALAYDTGSVDFDKYGKNAVLFRASDAIECFHYTDDEDQVIFDIDSVTEMWPVYGDQEGGGDLQLYAPIGSEIAHGPRNEATFKRFIEIASKGPKAIKDYNKKEAEEQLWVKKKGKVAAGLSKEALEAQGYKFEPQKFHSATGYGVYVFFNGERIGQISWSTYPDSDYIFPNYSGVDEAHRRKGIGTVLYDMAEQISGKRLEPSEDLSRASYEFWKKRLAKNPKAMTEWRQRDRGKELHNAADYASEGVQAAWRDEGMVDGHWGSSASGCLFISDNGKVLLLKRSGAVEDPGMWGIPGGAIPVDETGKKRDALESALAETKEELGGIPKGATRLSSATFKKGDFTFETFCMRVPDEGFEAGDLGWESEEAHWFPLNELPSPLHPGVQWALDRLGVKASEAPTDAELNSELADNVEKGWEEYLEKIGDPETYAPLPGFDSSLDMLRKCWVDLENQYFTPDAIAQFFDEEFTRAYDEVSQFVGNGPIKLYRKIALPIDKATEFIELAKQGKTLQSYGGFGIFWSHDPKSAAVYWAPEGQTNDILLEVEAPESSIDWVGSLQAQIKFGDDEDEIRLKKGAPIRLLSLVYGAEGESRQHVDCGGIEIKASRYAGPLKITNRSRKALDFNGPVLRGVFEAFVGDELASSIKWTYETSGEPGSDDFQDSLIVDWMETIPKFRRQGIATVLHEAFTDWAAKTYPDLTYFNDEGATDEGIAFKESMKVKAAEDFDDLRKAALRLIEDDPAWTSMLDNPASAQALGDLQNALRDARSVEELQAAWESNMDLPWETVVSEVQ